MRRVVARGRVFPQSYSTDRRIGRLSLKAWALFPLLWVNADDQGRLSGDPDEIKYACCPNIDHIAKIDIPLLLEELEQNQLIKVYATSKTQAIQMLDWWEEELKLQWAYPSKYPPPEGWTDHLRYHPSPKEIITENWPPGEPSSSTKKLPSKLPKELPSNQQEPPLTTPGKRKRKRKRKRKGEGEGNLPSALGSALGSRPPPSPADLSLFESLNKTFPQAFGRKPDSREAAQLRDLAKEISSAGGATIEQIHDAFKEAALGQKFSVSYVRAILLDWLGVKRNRSP